MGKEKDLPKIDFSTFIVSLGTSAQLHLGLVEHPSLGKVPVSLPDAQHIIDILEMLQQKTANNLAKEEEELLRHLLYELHVSFVAQKDKK